MTAKTVRRCIGSAVAAASLALPAACAAGGPSPRQTIDTLRFNYTAAQLDHLYSTLPAGQMPIGTSRGFVRFELVHGDPLSANRPVNVLLNDPLTPFFWKGQVWSINSDGQHELVQRSLNDRTRPFPGYVHYAKSLVDGKQAMAADYPGNENPPPINNIVLECRTVQRGVLMCYAWEFVIKPYVGPKTLLFYVFQDFTNPI
jgi:hypothetical protein